MLNKIYGTETKKDIHEMLINDLKDKNKSIIETYNKYLPFLWEQGLSYFTIRNKYQAVKKDIEGLRMNQLRKKEILAMFTLDNTFFTYINQSSNENLKERINDKKEFSEKEYQNKIKQIKTIIKNKGAGFKTINRQSSDYVLANLSAIYIALVTGRRMYEIFKTLDIVKNGKTTFFIGLLKKDDEKKDDKYKAYLLDDDFKFIKLCLKTVRGYYEEVLKDFDNRRFNNSYRGSINKFLKQVMADDETINNVTYATLRDMYTDIAIKKFKPDNMDDELFRNVVLSHELEDIKLGLSASYRKTKSK